MAKPGSASRRTTSERERGTRIIAPGREPEALERMSADLALLGHPVRLQILDILVRRGGEVCVCDLERAVPVKQPTVSHHLRLLREAGWVDMVRQGVWAHYFVRPDVIRAVRQRVQRVADWLGVSGEMCSPMYRRASMRFPDRRGRDRAPRGAIARAN